MTLLIPERLNREQEERKKIKGKTGKNFFDASFLVSVRVEHSINMLKIHPTILRVPQVGILRSGLVRYSTKPRISNSLWTIPNVLTYTRILTTPAIGYYIVSGNSTMALLLFTYSCVTDFVDGFIARKFNMKSVVGSIIDPLADKFLMTACTLSLGYIHAIPPAIASIIIGRDVMLSFMSFYYRYKSLPAPRTFEKFVSIGQVPTISVHPNLLEKPTLRYRCFILKFGIPSVVGTGTFRCIFRRVWVSGWCHHAIEWG